MFHLGQDFGLHESNVSRVIRKVEAIYFGKGKTHDDKLSEKSGVRVVKEVGIKADSGYQGLRKKHGKVLLPKKQSKLKVVDQRGKTSHSGVIEKTNQSRKCDSAIEDLSDFGRALPKSEKTARTKI